MEERDLIESRWFLPLSLHTLTPSHPPSHPHPLTPTFSYSPYIPSQLLIHPHTPTLSNPRSLTHLRTPTLSQPTLAPLLREELVQEIADTKEEYSTLLLSCTEMIEDSRYTMGVMMMMMMMMSMACNCINFLYRDMTVIITTTITSQSSPSSPQLQSSSPQLQSSLPSTDRIMNHHQNNNNPITITPPSTNNHLLPPTLHPSQIYPHCCITTRSTAVVGSRGQGRGVMGKC